MLNKKGAADYIVPMLVVLFASVVGIITLLTLASAEESAREEAVQEFNSDLELIRELNNFLEEKIVFGGNEIRRIDLMATVNDGEDEKINLFSGEKISALIDPIKEKWWFELRTGDGKILSTGSGVPPPKQLLKTAGCTLPYLFGEEKLFDNEYRIDLPSGGVLLLCY